MKAKIILGLAVVVLLVISSWQIASAYIANAELQEDMRDVAAQVGMRIGLDAPASEDDLRKTILRKAESYDIELLPQQVSVTIKGRGKDEMVMLGADYTDQVHIFFFAVPLHFTATSVR